MKLIIKRQEQMMHHQSENLQEYISTFNSVSESVNGWPHEIQIAITYIEEHFLDPHLTVHKIQENCYSNGHDFSTIFRHYVGMPPKEYIIHYRIEAPKKVLSHSSFSSVPILSVAKALGFSGTGAFNHAFKKSEGMTPGKWRKQKRAEKGKDRKDR